MMDRIAEYNDVFGEITKYLDADMHNIRLVCKKWSARKPTPTSIIVWHAINKIQYRGVYTTSMFQPILHNLQLIGQILDSDCFSYYYLLISAVSRAAAEYSNIKLFKYLHK